MPSEHLELAGQVWSCGRAAARFASVELTSQRRRRRRQPKEGEEWREPNSITTAPRRTKSAMRASPIGHTGRGEARREASE